jgi:hypothetical protein
VLFISFTRQFREEIRSSCPLNCVFPKNAEKIGGREGNIGRPSTEATMLIHIFCPFGEEFAFGPVLLTFLTLHFEDKNQAQKLRWLASEYRRHRD